MGFAEAIKTVVVKKYATFSGRASRSEFWWFFLFFIGVDILFEIGISFFVRSETVILLASIVTIGFSLGLLIPFLAVMVRRLHDRNMPGWWACLWILVHLLTIFGFFFPQFTDVIDILTSIIGLFILALLISLAFKGTNGANRFGIAPIASKINEDIFS